MSTDAMEVDPSSEGHTMQQKAEALHRLATGQLSSSLSKLLVSSRDIPSNKDFHFYHNFNDFKVPIEEIAEKSKIMLDTIGSSSAHLWDKEMDFPEGLDEAYDWLVNMNDEVYQSFDALTDDEFRRLGGSNDDYQLVSGIKKEGHGQEHGTGGEKDHSPPAKKLVSKDTKVTLTKAKVSFHMSSIARPQDEYKIMVNNSNQPFEHVWLQRGDGGLPLMHPQEKLSFTDFVDKDIEHVQPVKPLPIEDTPFKMVEDVRDLKLLAAKLRIANEFAVDLEHNQYRSFQGLTCLMQISTRTEDFVVDTLKLRIHIGPYLREVFKDPTKRKVLHGANNDIFWLQRDFGIYVCNMFDTGQASRVLKLERFSLEYLLSHFCGVTANKEYQNADWRLRPLPEEMIKYAREDTHYLLYIYDLLRIRLHSTPSQSESEPESDLLTEAYKRSYDLCMQLYEKELWTDTSYLHIYGLQNADFNAQQLAIVAGLCQWRDTIARAEDESTGYILPNKTVLEIAKEMPYTTNNLKRVLKSKHQYVERNLSAVVSIIRHSVQNYSSFEAAVQELREKRQAEAVKKNSMDSVSQPLPVEASANDTKPCDVSAYYSKLESLFSDPPEKGSSSSFNNVGQVRISEPPGRIGIERESLAFSGEVRGNSEKQEIKLEQIQSSKNNPSHAFTVKIDQLADESEPLVIPTITSKANEIICLDSDSDTEVTEASEHLDEEHGKGGLLKFDSGIICLDSDSDIEETVAVVEATENNELPGLVMVNGGEQQIEMLSSALLSSFQDCLESDNPNGNTRGASG